MVRHVNANVAGSEVARIIRADGCVLIDNLVTPEIMDQVLGEMAPKDS